MRSEKYYRDWDSEVKRAMQSGQFGDNPIPVRNSKGIVSFVPPHKALQIMNDGGRIDTKGLNEREQKGFDRLF